MDYTQLDRPTQLSQVRARLHELEGQHLVLKLQIEAPGPSEVVTQDQHDSLALLESSIESLRAKADELVRPNRAGDQPKAVQRPPEASLGTGR